MPTAITRGGASALAYGWTTNTIRTDSYFPYVTMLLPGNGTNLGQNNTFLDSSVNNFTVTRNGNTTQGTNTPYGPNWGNFFIGNGSFLTIPYSSVLDMTGDFTVEAWIYRQTAKLYEVIGGRWGTQNIWLLNLGGTGTQVWWQRNGISTFQANFTFSLNTWYHIAVARSGTTTTIYVNGTSIGSLAGDTYNYSNATRTLLIARNAASTDGTQDFAGYISNFRIVNGTAVYTSNFVPPAAPLTPVTNTVVLTCQSNRFIDNSVNNFAITVSGTTSTQRFSPFNPPTSYKTSTIGGSSYFDGSGDFLTVPDNAALEPGSGNLTWEMWINTTSSTQYATLYSRTPSTFASGMWTLLINLASATAGDVGLYVANFNTATPLLQTTGVNVRDGGWHHIAVVRNGSAWTMYVDGTSRATGTWAGTIVDIAGNPYIGRDQNYTRDYTGYITDVRIINGSALYTSNFTPPTAPLTPVTNTQLLLNFTNSSIIDNAMMNDLETLGSAQISTTQSKFDGSSVSFNGSTSYLKAPSSPDNRLNVSGNFTIEFWAYFNSVAADQRLIAWDNNTSGFVVAIYVNATGTLSYYLSSTGTAWNIAGPVSMGSVAINTWYHVALVRNGSVFTPYINGVAGTATTNSSALATSTLPFTIGAVGNGASPFNGYIDDFRITRGVARYTTNFTPPIAPFPTQ